MTAAFAIPLGLQSYSPRSKKALGAVALVWLAYAAWEAYITQWRSPTGDMAIRVDIVLLAPVLLVAFIVGVAVVLFGYKRGV